MLAAAAALRSLKLVYLVPCYNFRHVAPLGACLLSADQLSAVGFVGNDPVIIGVAIADEVAAFAIDRFQIALP